MPSWSVAEATNNLFFAVLCWVALGGKAYIGSDHDGGGGLNHKYLGHCVEHRIFFKDSLRGFKRELRCPECEKERNARI